MRRKSEWFRYAEPTTPMAMGRLSPLESEMLLAQRHLDWAIINDDVEAASRALVNLGLFEEAHALVPSERTTKRIAAMSAEPCDCPKPIITVMEGTRPVQKQISNFFAAKLYPQGTLWRCSDCGDDVLLDGFPDDLTRHRAEMLANFPGRHEGPDTKTLKNVEETNNKAQLD